MRAFPVTREGGVGSSEYEKDPCGVTGVPVWVRWLERQASHGSTRGFEGANAHPSRKAGATGVAPGWRYSAMGSEGHSAGLRHRWSPTSAMRA